LIRAEEELYASAGPVAFVPFPQIAAVMLPTKVPAAKPSSSDESKPAATHSSITGGGAPATPRES
jgi:hypothetical protein